MNEQRKKVGVALGGGGARGFCHIGVLQVLEENNIPVDAVSGCSIGAVVGGGYVSGMPLYEMSKAINRFDKFKLMDFDIMMRRQGLFKGNRALKFIEKLIGDINFEDCKIPFATVAVDAKNIQLVTHTEGRLLDAIRASFAIPGLFQSHKVGKHDCLIDGGVLERIPIKAVKDFGVDVVIAVDALGAPEPVESIKSFLDMIIRAYNILDWECSINKMQDADIIITPCQKNKSILDFKNNAVSVECGRQAALEALPKIKELLQLD